MAIVTGASRGIGRATARRLAEAGARVSVIARRGELLQELVASSPERFHAIEGDVSREEDVERLFSETESRFGPCTMLVNNAGTIDPKPLVEVSRKEWDEMFAVNVTGTFLTIRRAIPLMLSIGRGSIVNVASISGVAGPQKFPGFVSYCASKAAVIMLTESLAAELRDTPLRINAVSPGSVDTEMWSKASGGAPADMTPEEIAESIFFLLTAVSRPVNGQNLHVYGP
ncbi:MAG: SDR family oxidoreductase [Acidobacteria bacterium]|nr:SDR family oxidoreductase [Acidobacteriota bacterium]